jgi:hypothetical protein
VLVLVGAVDVLREEHLRRGRRLTDEEYRRLGHALSIAAHGNVWLAASVLIG